MRDKYAEKLKLCILEILMIIVSLVVFIPILIIVFGSFKTSAEAIKVNILPPTRWHFDNYLFVINRGGIGNAMKNSLLITFISVVLIVLMSILCAFVLARRKGRFSAVIYNLILMGMIAPMQLITTFGLLKLLNLMGTYAGVIMIFCATQIPWSVYMLIGFVKGIPKEMDEAAFIDGANPFQMIFIIIMPILRPVIATITVVFSMSVWNDIMIPLFFLNTSQKWTMPLTVYNFFGQYSSDWNYVFADLVLTALPVVILYLFLQKYVVSGMTSGAVKG